MLKQTLSEETKEPLGHFDFEEPSAGARRDGWVLVTAGETFIWMATMPAALIYQSYRDGTNFWFWFVLALIVIGGGLAATGQRIRSREDTSSRRRFESWILSAAGEP